MTSELDSVVAGLAETLVTGTAPGKPAAPRVPMFITGTVTAVSAPTVTVAFPDKTIAGLSYLLTGRTPVVNDVVLALQTAQQRLVIAAISH